MRHARPLLMRAGQIVQAMLKPGRCENALGARRLVARAVFANLVPYLCVTLTPGNVTRYRLGA